MAQQQVDHDETVLLDTEYSFWIDNRESLVAAYPNQWLLIDGDQVVGHFLTHREASDADAKIDAPLMIFASTEEPEHSVPTFQVTGLNG